MLDMRQHGLGINEGPIEVKITLQKLRYTILQVIYDHSDEIKKVAEEEVDKAIKEFDIRGEIKGLINSILAETIKKSITSTIRDVFYQDEVQDLIKDFVLNEIKIILPEEK